MVAHSLMLFSWCVLIPNGTAWKYSHTQGSPSQSCLTALGKGKTRHEGKPGRISCMIHVTIHMNCGTRKIQGQDELVCRRTHRATKTSGHVTLAHHVQSPPGFPSEFFPELQQKSA